MKKTISFLFFVLVTVSSFTQKQHLPQGKWQGNMAFFSLNVAMKANISPSKIIITGNITETVKKDSFEIIKIKANLQKGKILVKHTKKNEYSVGFFYKITPDAMMMLHTSKPVAKNKKEADKLFENAEKTALEKLVKPDNKSQIDYQGLDIYTMGVVWYTQKKYNEYSELSKELPDKRNLLKIMDNLIFLFRTSKTKTWYGMSSLGDYYMQQAFVKRGLHPQQANYRFETAFKQHLKDPIVDRKGRELVTYFPFKTLKK